MQPYTRWYRVTLPFNTAPNTDARKSGAHRLARR